MLFFFSFSTTAFVATLGADVFENYDFTLYPNPTKNILNIALKNNTNIIDNIWELDVLGKTIIFKKANNAKATINLSEFSKGVYFVKIVVNGTEKVIKILKE